ncbi:iron chelate uptake ABC transporter family permease subunit, partial [Pseudomonas aeruginosa]|uniref:iron chelate uptake ABC transporter family permease subunit n=1 Tax=Pseudomonas aeruginosa TaxID=287 RepID=UPI003F78EE9C
MARDRLEDRPGHAQRGADQAGGEHPWQAHALDDALACLVLAGVGLALAAALLGTGSLALGPAEVFASLLGQGQDPTAQRIVQRVRLPRVLTACLVGAALGMAGAIFQS